jgi:hypothetical protein
MKRVLILVLSTDKDFYGNLYRASTETWDNKEIEGVETVFYFARYCALPIDPSDPKVLRVDCGDDFFDMGRKTVGAFEWALHYRAFDYIFRANASLFINKPGLLKYVRDKPKTDLALGVVADCGQFEGERFSYLWGPSYLLSRDVVEKIVANQAFWDHRLMDDNAISRLLTQLGIPLDNRGSMASLAKNERGYEFVYYENGVSGGVTMQSLSQLREWLPNQFAFRCKCDSDREIDIRLMKELHAIFDV